MQAVDCMFHVLSSFRQGLDDVDFKNLQAMPEDDRKTIRALFTTLIDDNGDRRHQQWLQAVASGRFSFGPEQVYYNPNEKRWKMEALKPVDAGRPKVVAYSSTFLTSHWKLFNDALMAHRFAVIRDILPRYEICAV